jgi:hypothetical protein
MPTLLDELRADQGRPTQCQVCVFIESRPTDEQKEWDSACADRSFTHSSVHRALMRRKYEGTKGPSRTSVENHRKNSHRP